MSVRVLVRLLFTLVPVAAMCVWFNHRAPVPKPPSIAKAQSAPAPMIAPPQDAGNSTDEPRHYRPRQVSEAARRKVDDFIRRYRDTPPEEAAKSEEMTSMMQRFTRMLDVPEFQNEMEKRMEAIKAARGQEHGTLNIGFGKLGDPESRAWLEAMFSDDADLLQEYILNKLDGAIFEFAFDPTLENAGNGVTVKGSAPPPPAENKLPD